MDLKEKVLEFTSDDGVLYESEELVDFIENFTTDFAKWVDEKYVCFQGNYQRRTDNYWHTNNLSIKSVFEIYRQEVMKKL